MNLKLKSELIAILLLSFILSACSSVKIGYSLFDNFLRWKVDEYVTLDPTQRKTLNTSIDTFVQWHKRNELPQYASFIEQHLPKFQTAQMSPQQLEQVIDGGVAFWEKGITELMPAISTMLVSLNAEQAEEFIANIDKKNKEYIQEHFRISAVKRQRVRQKKMIKRLAKFTGRLDKSQRARIVKWSSELKFATEMRLQQRRLFHDRFLSLLGNRKTNPNFQPQLNQLMVHPETFWSAKYKNYVEESKQLTYAMLADISNSLSDNQRKHLVGKLKRYQSDLLSLSR